jgi:cytidylate kinase
VKIFLTADSAVRAMRRYKELTDKNIECDLKRIEEEIIKRDHQDMNRSVSPLRQAEEAVLLDTSLMSIEEVVEAIIKIVERL